jgi:hypothetical protein
MEQQGPSALEQQYGHNAAGNLIEMSTYLYVDSAKVRDHLLEKLRELKQSARIVVKHVNCPPDCNPMDMIPDELVRTQTYDNGVYLSVFMNWALAAIWLMTKSEALEWLGKQGFEGKPEDIFNKLLIFKIGAGRVGPALVSNTEGTCLGRSGPSHR